ncbi:hypothetical protein OEB99_10705 [Actinotalea sp. M2MS4P-6]|uniref:hypothetical protein n=1 Tax=Actinotalea sp. M2MS4P-6 TaxID=2983762 RepID=UPI0021E46BA4|nr:hypothetical protein [Actinotalea sp. M2MS4P-6]MCV2394778.1 hypothetical protein [Actinotalea sp. M2MS4P-6]
MTTTVPDSLPVLAPGAHRRRTDGGCFMEWASLLAGERWSDHPSCTHPLLAHLARSVNDRVGDLQRQRLVPLIPDVIGLTSTDPRWDLEIALVAVRRAAPEAADEDLTRALAAGLLTLDRALASRDGRSPGALRPSTAATLARIPDAAAWAEQFTAELTVTRFGSRDLARTAVDHAVGALAAGGADALLGVLEDAVAVCARLAGRSSAALGAPVTAGAGAR